MDVPAVEANNDGLMNSANWRIDTTKTNCLGYDGLMLHFENALKANPKTTFIACHYLNMNHDLPRLGRLLDQYPNLYLDISAVFRNRQQPLVPRANSLSDMPTAFFSVRITADVHRCIGQYFEYWKVTTNISSLPATAITGR